MKVIFKTPKSKKGHNMQRRVLLILFATLLIDMVGFGMVFPIIPILFTDASSPSFLLHGYSAQMQLFLAGAVTAIWGITQFFAAPIMGELSDTYGRKKLLLFGVGILGATQILFGFSIAIASVPVLFISRALAGIAAGNIGIAQASIADITEPKDRAKNFGLIGASLGLGLIIGPLLSGWLSHAFGNPAVPFFVAGILGLFNIALVFLVLPETNKDPKATGDFTLLKGIFNIRAAISDNNARQTYIAGFLYFVGLHTFTTNYAIFLAHQFGFSESQAGMAFAAVGTCTAFTQIVILRVLSKYYSEKTLLSYSLPLVATSVIASIFMPTAPLFLLFIPLVAVPHAITQASIPALISRSVSPYNQGAALGINSSLLALAFTISPILMGVSSGLFGLQAPFVITALFMYGAWSVLSFGKEPSYVSRV
jgi:DHA1 family tetracycline resistance protein-like MFS transporter